jgi:hypothetical protein
MIATIAGTAVASLTVIITRVQRNTKLENIHTECERGEPGGFPLSLFYCVVSEARWKHACFASDAHRKSGVISCSAALSPVES